MPYTAPLHSDQREDYAKPLPGRPVPLCTHVMPSGATCGSPAVKETALCYHHSDLNIANAPHIPFVFPQDRVAIQLNYFLLLQAFTQGHIDLRAFNSMQRMLRAMAANFDKMPSLSDDCAAAPEPPIADPSNAVPPNAGPPSQAAPSKKEPKKPSATTHGPCEKSAENNHPRPVAQNTAPQKPSTTHAFPSFEEIAAQLKPLGAECFLNIPSLSNSLTGFSMTANRSI